MTSGQSTVTSLIVITLNLDFISTCRKKSYSQFHWSILTWPEQLTQIWMCCKEHLSTTLGMLVEIEPCPIHGQGSWLSRCWMRNVLQDICGPRSAWRRFKQLPDLTVCGLRFGFACRKQPKSKKSKNGLLMGCWETKARQCSKTERYLLRRSGRRRV